MTLTLSRDLNSICHLHKLYQRIDLTEIMCLGQRTPKKRLYTCPNQHGFRKGLSCETQLVDIIHELAHSVNQNTQTDVIFLDFSKASDKVSHDKLLHKIHYYGIGGKTNTWISAFLCFRSQHVVVNGQTSQSAGVLSRVPQGSV